MAACFFLQNATFLLIVLVLAVSGTYDTDITTSCTTITLKPSIPPSTFITVTTTVREILSEVSTEGPESTELEPQYTAKSGPNSEKPESTESESQYTAESGPVTEELEPTKSAHTETAELSRGGRPMAGPHYITRPIPLAQLPTAIPQPASQKPAVQQSGAQPPKAQTPYQGAVPTADSQPPSTTWRYDPVIQPRPTPKPCNELNEMAFARYKYTMELCKKAAEGGPEETKRLLKKLRGYDFLAFCKVSPPVDCCFDVQEMLHAKRCYSWWPDAAGPDYYELPPGIKSVLNS